MTLFLTVYFLGGAHSSRGSGKVSRGGGTCLHPPENPSLLSTCRKTDILLLSSGNTEGQLVVSYSEYDLVQNYRVQMLMTFINK